LRYRPSENCDLNKSSSTKTKTFDIDLPTLPYYNIDLPTLPYYDQAILPPSKQHQIDPAPLHTPSNNLDKPSSTKTETFDIELPTLPYYDINLRTLPYYNQSLLSSIKQHQIDLPPLHNPSNIISNKSSVIFLPKAHYHGDMDI